MNRDKIIQVVTVSYKLDCLQISLQCRMLLHIVDITELKVLSHQIEMGYRWYGFTKHSWEINLWF